MAYILVAEDDRMLSDGLSKTLRHSGYSVDQACCGVDAEAAVLANPYDLMILDLGLPDVDGLTVLDNLRRSGKSLPILILTARDGTEDRIRGLDSGANDYLCKPFNMGELEARIRALIRKEKYANRVEIQSGSLVFDTVANKFLINDEVLELSFREYLVLELLLQRKGRVVMRDDLLEHLANSKRELTKNALDIVIHRLRKKIEHSGCLIQTVKGLGFIIEN